MPPLDWRRDIVAFETTTLLCDGEKHRTRFAIVERGQVEVAGRKAWGERIVGGMFFESRNDAEFFARNLPLGTNPLYVIEEDQDAN